MKRFITALGVTMALALSANAQTITLKAGHSAAPAEPYHTGLVDFAQRVEQATQGKTKVQIFPSSQLGSEREMIEGLQLGTVDIAVAANAVLTNFVPDLIALDMPFLFRDQEHFDKALRGPVADSINEAAAARGFRVLGLFSAGVRHIMTSGRPVNSVADLKGMKIRTMQNPAHVATFNALGANATPIAYGELYGALQTGVVNGAEAANTNYSAQRFYEVAPNWAMVGWTVLISPVIMSEAKFRSLPKATQDALMAAGRDASIAQRAAYAASDDEKLKTLGDGKVKVTRPDIAQFRSAVTPVYEKFVTTPIQKKIVSQIEASK
jgi:tripartite ATP-independent transporter DctP family solute receptor